MKKSAGLILLLFFLFLVSGFALAESQIGSSITLGSWEGLPLKWQILSVNGERALLYLEQSLPAQPYNVETKAVTWQTCTLRTWLQGTFVQSAFTPSEAAAILLVTNENPATYGTAGGGPTEDTVFLLSRNEFEAYFPILKDRKTVLLTAPDPNAKAGTVPFVSSYDQASPYWLRSPGTDEKHASAVSWSGIVESHSVKVTTIGVRPAMWVDLAALTDR